MPSKRRARVIEIGHPSNIYCIEVLDRQIYSPLSAVFRSDISGISVALNDVSNGTHQQSISNCRRSNYESLHGSYCRNAVADAGTICAWPNNRVVNRLKPTNAQSEWRAIGLCLKEQTWS